MNPDIPMNPDINVLLVINVYGESHAVQLSTENFPEHDLDELLKLAVRKVTLAYETDDFE
jgi:hypothetical protein